MDNQTSSREGSPTEPRGGPAAPAAPTPVLHNVSHDSGLSRDSASSVGGTVIHHHHYHCCHQHQQSSGVPQPPTLLATPAPSQPVPSAQPCLRRHWEYVSPPRPRARRPRPRPPTPRPRRANSPSPQRPRRSSGLRGWSEWESVHVISPVRRPRGSSPAAPTYRFAPLGMGVSPGVLADYRAYLDARSEEGPGSPVPSLESLPDAQSQPSHVPRSHSPASRPLSPQSAPSAAGNSSSALLATGPSFLAAGLQKVKRDLRAFFLRKVLELRGSSCDSNIAWDRLEEIALSSGTFESHVDIQAAWTLAFQRTSSSHFSELLRMSAGEIRQLITESSNAADSD